MIRRIAIVGSRNWNNTEVFKVKNCIWAYVNSFNRSNVEIVSGGARGVDKWAEYAANAKKIKCKIFLPDWQKYGKKAGFIRNKQIAEYCTELICFWNGESRGCVHTVDLVKNLGKPTLVVKLDD